MASQLGQRPLCTAGRCAQILSAIAEAQTMQRLGEQYGQALADIIRGVLVDFEVDVSDPEVGEAVRRHIARVTGVPEDVAALYRLGQGRER